MSQTTLTYEELEEIFKVLTPLVADIYSTSNDTLLALKASNSTDEAKIKMARAVFEEISFACGKALGVE